jgi:hypothetical protein
MRSRASTIRCLRGGVFDTAKLQRVPSRSWDARKVGQARRRLPERHSRLVGPRPGSSSIQRSRIGGLPLTKVIRSSIAHGKAARCATLPPRRSSTRMRGV